MSLLTNNKNWLSLDGNPTQGITPPSVRVRAGDLTPARRSMLAAAYDQFCTAKKLSVAGGGYFTGDKRLPDGTIVRMVSINGVDHVHVWAADPVAEETEGVTFWCQPWDAEWLDEQYQEVFTIPRWFDINGGEVEEDSPEDFLDDLTRNATYEPYASANYPGNQTWFAPADSPLAGVVVSWWGPPKRYATSERDLAVAGGGPWGRATWPLTENDTIAGRTSEELTELLYAPTGGISGAVEGHMFDLLGATELPPGVTPVGRPQLAATRLWINGTPVQTPWAINSACLQNRSGDTYLRIATVSGTTLTIREAMISGEGSDWTVVGTASLAPASVGLGAPTTGHVGIFSYTWDSNYAYPAQPFHWSADGTKATSVVHYITALRPTHLTQRYGTHAVLEVTAVGGVTVGVADQTEETIEYETTFTSDPPIPDEPYATEDSSSTITTSSEYSTPVAADYRGGALTILRTHVSVDGSSLKSTDVTHATWESPDSDDDALYDATAINSATMSLEYESWATIGGTEISGTRTTRTVSGSGTSQITNVFEGLLGYTEYTSTSEYDLAGSGTVGLWGFCAGDLRGSRVILHNTPFSKLPSMQGICVDAQSDFSVTQVGEGEGYPEQSDSSIIGTVTDGADAGKLVLVDVGAASSSTIDHLISPTMRHNIGSLSWGLGALTPTRSGPYGAGPWIALDSLGVKPPINGEVSEAGLCPFHIYGSSAGTGGISRISVNSSRSPLWLGGSWISGSFDVVGGYGNTALSANALTPDKKTQYLGAVMIAMTDPTSKDAPECVRIEKWFHDGAEFTPLYPDQPDPENPGATMPFPHRGSYSILLDPIFIGPMP